MELAVTNVRAVAGRQLQNDGSCQFDFPLHYKCESMRERVRILFFLAGCGGCGECGVLG